MKKILSILLVVLCVGCLFAASFNLYPTKLSNHSAILGGINLTHAGVGINCPFTLENGNSVHLDASVAGGISERYLFQNPGTGEFLEELEDNVELFDVLNLEWELKGIYDYGENFHFTLGYVGNYEKRQDSMYVTGKYWPKKDEAPTMWLGGSEKRELTTGLESWFAGFGDNLVYPEFENEKSLFTGIRAGVQYDAMTDTMVANDGVIATLNFDCFPGFANRDADMYKLNLDVLVAKQLVDMKRENGLNMFALSVLDRLYVTYVAGKYAPTYFQEDISLGRHVRGFAARSMVSTFSAINNLELRLASPELMKGLFARLVVFFDCGIGAGYKLNSDVAQEPDFVASAGAQIHADYNDAVDLGIQVAYLLKGYNALNPANKLQTKLTISLDY